MSDIPFEEPLEIKTSYQIHRELESQYPNLYRAYKSMVSNYKILEITPAWTGGVPGIMQFIEDTKDLPNATTSGVKLKRKNTKYPFSKLNVYWHIPVSRQIKNTPGIQTKVLTVDDVNNQYPSTEAKSARFEELFSKSIQHELLTPTEQFELDVLGSLITTGSIPIEERKSKYEDI